MSHNERKRRRDCDEERRQRKTSREKFEKQYPGLWEEIVALFGEDFPDSEDEE